MRIKRVKRKLFEPSSVLSDLAFLLIIYFIVIAGFNINNGFLMNLPAKNSTRLLLKEDILKYEMDDQGAVIFNNRKLSLNEVEQDIAAAIREKPNLAVLLTISPAASWQNVVMFVEIAKKLSVDSFSFRMAADDGGITS